MVKFIGFDKDGTLLDTMSAYAKEWGRIIQDEFGVDATKATKIFIELAGEPTDVQLAASIGKHTKDFSQTVIFQKAEEIAYRLGENVKGNLFPEVIQVLEQLKSSNYSIFVSSGQREEITKEDLERTGILKYVDFYAGIRLNEPDFKKGEPHFRSAAKHFNIEFETFVNECIYVGDTLEDIDNANNLGILSVVRVGTFTKEKLLASGAKFAIDNLSDLLEILKTL